MNKKLLAPLDEYLRTECDFSFLQIDELPFAVAWEYLREVPALNIQSDGKKNSDGLLWVTQKLTTYFQNEEARRYDLENESALLRVLTFLGEKKPFPIPSWSSLPDDCRRALMRGQLWDPVSIFEAKHESNSKYSGTIQLPLPPLLPTWALFASICREGAPNTVPGCPPLLMNDKVMHAATSSGLLHPVLMVINVTEYTRADILKAFDQWLADHSSQLKLKDNAPGKPAYDPRKRLEWLIGMRLIYRMSNKEMAESKVVAAILEGNKMSIPDRSKFRETFVYARRDACTFFQKVIALNKDEKPLKQISCKMR